jgi:hypothetical protein
MAQHNPLRLGRILFAAFLLSALGKSGATPVYYSFQGEVVYSTLPEYALGRTVSYTFLVDQEVDGYEVDGQGGVIPLADDIEAVDWFRLSFLSSYVGGDAIMMDNPNSNTKMSEHDGVDQVQYHPNYFSALNGSNSDPSGFDVLSIYSVDTRINDWFVGQKLLAENFVQNEEGVDNSSYSSSLTLTGITCYNPLAVTAVPEPGTLALFGFGALGLGFLFRPRRSRGRFQPRRSDPHSPTSARRRS